MDRAGASLPPRCHIRCVRYERTDRRTVQTCLDGSVSNSEAVVLIEAEESFGSYAQEWLDQRIDLAERTDELYAWLLARHVLPTFGSVALTSIGTPAVSRWFTDIARTRPTTAAKAYRLMSSIMRTAETDGLIVKNPCQVRGASVERAPERPIATMTEVKALASLMPDELRIAVILAAWCQLRRGQVRGLRRKDIDLDRGRVTIDVTRATAMSGRTIVKEPKTRAGRRTVAVPPNALAMLAAHLDARVATDEDAFIVPGTDRSLGVAWAVARAGIDRLTVPARYGREGSQPHRVAWGFEGSRGLSAGVRALE